ncbi:flagellar biosynthetic protein FliQ [Pandoraea pulmonicola]|uniref:Flagellar biosynthetic protein FliQ n=1 Tax=Pandoraea pulmonicola TaxID=93221 RepID=A0AAJ5D026_PANPU|nr:flagellar biosynthetic protein FliQ [Pandoraea pulmonicola]AJC21210.1 flagellar biosynthetic protein FliQ [Pandoraea pulmonicola]SUA90110.1 Flagellar biosynthetic protein FliQ [Pandoraea pulmonicola]
MLTADIAVEIVGQALRIATVLIAGVVMPSLVVGLLVSLFQAATSINEQTLSFLPRLLTTLVVLMIGGHWGTQYLMDYCVSVFERAALLVG